LQCIKGFVEGLLRKTLSHPALLQLGGSALHMSITRICLCRMMLAQWRPKLPFTGCPSQGAQQQEWLTEWHFETETSHYSFLLLKVLYCNDCRYCRTQRLGTALSFLVRGELIPGPRVLFGRKTCFLAVRVYWTWTNEEYFNTGSNFSSVGFAIDECLLLSSHIRIPLLVVKFGVPRIPPRDFDQCQNGASQSINCSRMAFGDWRSTLPFVRRV
jgi:hypothetical protein